MKKSDLINIRSVVQSFGWLVFVVLLFTMTNSTVRGQMTDAFNPNVESTVFAIETQPDGKAVIGGSFTSVGGQPRGHIARVNGDGTLDTTFPNLGLNDIVYAVALQPDGKILIGGTFTVAGGQTRNCIARLNQDGTLDTVFNPNINGGIYAIQALPDGKILIGGFITSVGGTSRNNFARLNADGTLDASFTTNADATVSAIVRQPDGKILVGGFFSNIGGSARNRLVRLNADGSIDTSFNQFTIPYGNGAGIMDIALQSDGKIIVGGYVPQDASVKAVIKLDANGTFDTAFNQNVEPVSGVVRAVAVQSSGKVLFGGIITNAPKPFRLNADGPKDLRFNANPSGSVFALAVQADQKILVGGIYNSIGGANRNNFARLLSESPFTAINRFDFDGDNKADISAFRPSAGIWYIQNSSVSLLNPPRTLNFGVGTDRLAPGDYDADGKADVAVFRAGSTAYFYMLQSQTNTFRAEAFGTTGDVPAVGDWDGDLKTDLAVYRVGGVAGAQSYFYYRPTATIGVDFRQIVWGTAGDKPVAADYDADGKTDAAVFRPSSGIWYVARSSDGQFQAAQFGLASDKLVPADYDGDNKTDLAVFRSGVWYIQRSQLGFTAVQFGIDTDLPAPADYDGDLKADLAVFRNGTWYLNRSTAGLYGGNFHAAGDIPVPGADAQ